MLKNNINGVANGDSEKSNNEQKERKIKETSESKTLLKNTANCNTNGYFGLDTEEDEEENNFNDLQAKEVEEEILEGEEAEREEERLNKIIAMNKMREIKKNEEMNKIKEMIEEENDKKNDGDELKKEIEEKMTVKNDEKINQQKTEHRKKTRVETKIKMPLIQLHGNNNGNTNSAGSEIVTYKVVIITDCLVTQESNKNKQILLPNCEKKKKLNHIFFSRKKEWLMVQRKGKILNFLLNSRLNFLLYSKEKTKEQVIQVIEKIEKSNNYDKSTQLKTNLNCRDKSNKYIDSKNNNTNNNMSNDSALKKNI